MTTRGYGVGPKVGMPGAGQQGGTWCATGQAPVSNSEADKLPPCGYRRDAKGVDCYFPGSPPSRSSAPRGMKSCPAVGPDGHEARPYLVTRMPA